MKALLINPHKLVPTAFSITPRPSPPLGLAYIAAVLQQSGCSVTVYDCVANSPDKYTPFLNHKNIFVQGVSFAEVLASINTPYDIIGVTCMFTDNWLVNRELINVLKKHFPNTLIIAGGEHVSAVPEFCLNDCNGLDIVVCGEGEETIQEIVEHLRRGGSFEDITGIAYRNDKSKSIILNSRRERLRKPETMPFPMWELFPLDKYFDNGFSYGLALGNSLPISATRGCPYECTFCSSPQMWTTKYAMRPVEDVIAEIKHLNSKFGATNIDFYDLTALVNRRWVLDFCAALKKENLKITWQIPAGTRSEVIDYTVAVALKETGCANITYAPESGSVRVLDYIKKRVNLERMIKSIKESHQAGLNVKLNIIIGFPEERMSDIWATLKFIVKASYYGARDASPSIFSPYPGSALFKQLQQAGKLTLNDKYLASIVTSDTFHSFVNYNNYFPKWWVVCLQYIIYYTFYASNFLFRPIRAVRFLVNVASGRFETRGEYMISILIERFFKINLMSSFKRK